jgi:hypothetical protein
MLLLEYLDCCYAGDEFSVEMFILVKGLVVIVLFDIGTLLMWFDYSYLG